MLPAYLLERRLQIYDLARGLFVKTAIIKTHDKVLSESLAVFINIILLREFNGKNKYQGCRPENCWAGSFGDPGHDRVH
jgi:hypothetical protein